MSDRILTLFPDTNLFVQCRQLHELPWGALGDYSEIHLIVCRPVQDEIDQHKNRGNERLTKRARMVSSKLFRPIAIGTTDRFVVRESEPVVHLFLDGKLRPDPMLGQELDYAHRDDQLVGVVHGYLRHSEWDTDVRVFTHDTGPMMTARRVGVGVLPIPDDWLLAPEPSESTKQIAALESEIARLKKAEPGFAVSCVDPDGKPVDELRVEMLRYTALTSAQVAELMKLIKARLPQRSPQMRPPILPTDMAILGDMFVPPTKEKIAQYSEEYSAWLTDCEDALRTWHEQATRTHRQAQYCLSAVNMGTRPGKDVAVTIQARGDFLIKPLVRRSSESSQRKGTRDQLPTPPQPPQGSWRNPLMEHFGGIPKLPVFTPVTGDFSRSTLAALEGIRPRDPNEFYFTPHRPRDPVESYGL